MHSTIQHHPKKMKRWDDDKVEKVHNKRTWFVMQAEVRWFTICNFNFKGFHSYFSILRIVQNSPFLKRWQQQSWRRDDIERVSKYKFSFYNRNFLTIRVHSSFYALDMQLAEILMETWIFQIIIKIFPSIQIVFIFKKEFLKEARDRKSSKKYLDHATQELFLKIETNYVI